ncbi:MAG: hypothetical protein AABX73_00240 [Nanoarchaeota archaeon]
MAEKKDSQSSELRRSQLLEDIAGAFNQLRLPKERLLKNQSEALQIANLYEGKEQLDALKVITEVYQMSLSGWTTLKITRLNYTLRDPIIVAREQVYKFIEGQKRTPTMEELKGIVRNELIKGSNCGTNSHSNRPIVSRSYKGLTPAQKNVKYRQSDKDI